MKNLLSIIALLLLIRPTFCKAQSKTEVGLPSNITTVATLDKPKMMIYKNASNQYFIARKLGKEWINWEFKKANSYPADKFELIEKQIDKKRKPEIIINWKHLEEKDYEEDMMSKHFEYDLTEIWNIDKQTCIFSAMTNRDEADYVNKKETHCRYNYSITISVTGDIILGGLKSETVNCTALKPDHEPGTYVFDGTQYVKKR